METFRDFSDVEIDESWTYDIKRSKTSYASNNYHRYPAKFIPQIPMRLVKEFSKPGDVVLDPFMGSGTTILEALLLERRAYGVDINPLCELITRVKIRVIEPEYLEKELQFHFDQLENILAESTDLESENLNQFREEFINLNSELPENERIEYWFPDTQIRTKLVKILAYIGTIQEPEIQDFLRCGFSHILKNTSIWLMKSVKPTRNKTKTPREPLWYLKRHLKKMERGNAEFFDIVPERMKYNLDQQFDLKTASATAIPYDDNSVQLIVTSPPYVTSYEYADLHQLSTLWFGYADNYKDVRSEFIGSMFRELEHDSKIKWLLKEIDSTQAQKTVKAFEEFSRQQLPVAVYFYDMQRSFAECLRVLQPGGYMAIVIGNTAIKRINIRNAEIFVEMLEILGMEMIDVIKRRIPSKILPQTRDKKTGRFTSSKNADRLAYPHEFILIARKR